VSNNPKNTLKNQTQAAALRTRTVLLGLTGVIWLCNLYRYHAYVIDDTFISLRYAHNLASGRGLVFNSGERVEGYTNFLLVMFAAACLRLGIDPVAATKWLCALAALCTLYCVTRIEDARSNRPRGPSLALSFLLPLQAFAYWSVCGMETMPFTALFLAALAVALQESRRRRVLGSAVLFVLLSLLRPEGALCFALCNAALATVEYRRARRWQHLGRYANNLVVFTAGFGTYFAWRYTYYGHLMPNTFVAKVTGGESELVSGLRYLSVWCLAFPFFAATLLFPALGLVERWRSALRADALALWAIVVFYILYVVAVGGDAMAFYRFFMPIMPLCAVLLAWTLEDLAPHRSGVWAAVCLASVGVSLLTQQSEVAFVAHRTAVVGTAVGRWFATALEPDDWIAVNTAGAVPYASGLPTIDMLGLADEAIARHPVFVVTPGWAGHRRGWGSYVLDRRPRVILWYNSAGAREPYYLGDRELADNPFFRFFYRLKTVTLPPLGGAQGHPVVARFLGFPFGTNLSGEGHWSEMGLSGTFLEKPISVTTLREAAIVVNYFERERRDDALWPLKTSFATNTEGFVDAVGARWEATPPVIEDRDARAQVEGMCADAHRMIESGDYAKANELLSRAAQIPAARSPLVYQYIANLGVLAGDLFTAVAAQKEALRLAPANALYRTNLQHLLTVPYTEGARPRVAESELRTRDHH